MRLRKGLQCFVLVFSCFVLSACTEKKKLDEKNEKTPLIMQDMSEAVDYYAQKWVWTDITGLEYDAEDKVFYVLANDFAEEMGRYFVMSDSTLKSIDENAIQGRIKICADAYQTWSWGFSFEIDQAEEKEGAYYIHGYNMEVTERLPRIGDEYIIGNKTDHFVYSVIFGGIDVVRMTTEKVIIGVIMAATVLSFGGCLGKGAYCQ